MATKRHRISVAVPQEVNLTPTERSQLEETFRTSVTQVFSACRPSDPSPFPEVNISGGGKVAAKKSSATKAKKASSKSKKASSKAKKR